MGVYLTDGLTVVDISESHIEKSDLPRYAVMKNLQDKDVTQTFGTLGRTITIDGVWDVSDGVNDGRGPIEYWKTNNILVKYDDSQATTISGFATICWANVVDFGWNAQRGRSGAVLSYHLEITESLRVTLDDRLALPSGQYIPALLTPGIGALQFSHNKHTFVDQNNHMWVASVQSNGIDKTRISFCMSSGGVEWSWVSDYVANVNRGSSIRFFAPNSVGIAWSSDHTLMFVMGSISYPGPTLTFGSLTSVNSSLTANEGNYRPDLFITPTPRFYISACSGNTGFQIWDSSNGNNWIAQANSDPGNVDPNRFSSVLVTSSTGASLSQIGYIKRIFGVENLSPTNEVFYTEGFVGPTENSYAHIVGDNAGLNFPRTVDQSLVGSIPSCGYVAVVALPFASYGSGFYLQTSSLKAFQIDETTDQNNWKLFTIDAGPIDNKSTAPQYIAAGLSSAEDQVNVFYMVNGFPKFTRTWNLRSDKTTPSIIAPKTTFGTGSVGSSSYLNTPDIPTLAQSLVVWQGQLGKAASKQTVYGGVP